MVYKNGIKEWTLMCCGCGLAYGFFISLFYGDMTMGIIAGVLCGTLFTLCRAIFSKLIEKKSAHLRAEISKVRKIICEGPANHKKGANSIGGWLFLSEDAIEFYPHKMNIGGQNIPILIDDILNIETKSKQLKIHTKANETFTFVVNKANLWKQSITEIL
jgi:hypothetical protein